MKTKKHRIAKKDIFVPVLFLINRLTLANSSFTVYYIGNLRIFQIYHI